MQTKSISIDLPAPRRPARLRSLLLALLCLGSLLWAAPISASAQTATEKVTAAADEAKTKVVEATEVANSKLDRLWRAIDENRLKHRTPDQIVAWLIMGLLVGGILSRVTKFNWVAAVVFGLIGAFVGGIIAKVTGIDLGLGPVLIRYEELLFAFLGGTLLLLAARWLGRPKAQKK